MSVASSAESKLMFCISKGSGGCRSVQEVISLQIIQLKQSVDITVLDLDFCYVVHLLHIFSELI